MFRYFTKCLGDPFTIDFNTPSPLVLVSNYVRGPFL